MTPETEGKEETGPSGHPFINDPGNEDPEMMTCGALMLRLTLTIRILRGE
ncbi:hypothetical protein ACYZUC_10905 [Pseudomonas sp. GT1P32]